MEKKIVGITGGTGFIGTALSRALMAQGYGVRIFTRREPKRRLEGAEYAVVSFSDEGSLARAADGCALMVHMAAVLFSRSYEGFRKANVEGAANLAAAVAGLANPPAKIVYVSSLAAGGPAQPGTPRTEAMSDEPVSHYGATKLAAEKHIKALAPKVRWTILRPPIVYGPNEYAVSKIADWVRKGVMVNPGSSSGSFSFIYVDDLTAAVIKALGEPATDGRTFYVGENTVYRWDAFIKMLSEAMRVRMPLMIDMPRPLLWGLGLVYEAASWLIGAEPVFNRDKAREGSAANWTLSPSEWEAATGWKGWTPLAEGVKKTFS